MRSMGLKIGLNDIIQHSTASTSGNITIFCLSRTHITQKLPPFHNDSNLKHTNSHEKYNAKVIQKFQISKFFSFRFLKILFFEISDFFSFWKNFFEKRPFAPYSFRSRVGGVGDVPWRIFVRTLHPKTVCPIYGYFWLFSISHKRTFKINSVNYTPILRRSCVF